MGVVVKQSLKGTIINYIGVAVGFVTTFFVMTKYLSTEEIGLASVLSNAAILFSGLAQMGTSTSAMRFYPYFKDSESRDHGFFGWTLIVPLVGFIIFTALFFIFKQQISDYFSEQSALFVDYMYFVIPMSFFMLYTVVFETNSNLLMRIVFPRFVREVGIRLFTLIDYLLYITNVIDLDGMVIGLCVTYLLATILNIIYLLSLRRISFKIEPSFVDKKLRRDFFLYTLLLIVSSVVSTIIPVLNSLLITAKMGLAFTGIYKIATDMAALVEMPYRALGSISKPNISQAMKDNDTVKARSLTKDVSLHQLIAGLFVFFIIWINIDMFFELLPNGEVFATGKWVFFILVLAKMINSSLNVGVIVLSYSKYYYLQLFFTAVLTFTAIVMNNLLIPVLGMTGSAMASLVSYSLYYVLILSVVGWKTKIHPFSWGEMMVVIIISVLFVADYLVVKFVSPSVVALLGGGLLGRAAESVIRTLFFVFTGIAAVYKLKISKQINDLIDILLKKLKLMGDD